jgi:hypothetical protein
MAVFVAIRVPARRTQRRTLNRTGHSGQCECFFVVKGLLWLAHESGASLQNVLSA